MYSVVIADDESLIRIYVREILENNGYKVVGEAKDGYDAIQICRETQPDFAILDIKMPLLDGLEASTIINEEGLANFTLLLTAFSGKEIAKKAAEADVMGFIVKPVDEDTLIPAIEIAINKYEKMQKLDLGYEKMKKALDDRKYVDRAKGILMDKNNMSEKDAYSYLRKGAMDKGCTIAELAKIILRVHAN